MAGSADAEGGGPPGDLHGAGKVALACGSPNTGTSQVSYCTNGLISKSFRGHKSPEILQSHCVLPPGMKSSEILALRTATWRLLFGLK